MEFKDKIKARRLELGMTLDDVARLVGVSNPTISRWESGAIVNQRRDKIELLAKALQLSPGELMGWGKDTIPIKQVSFDDSLTPAEEHMVESYRRAPQAVRDIVDVALAPYSPTASEDAAM